MMHKALPFLALAAWLATAAPALAQDGSRMIQQMEQADRNGDGAVSREELLTYRAGQFDRIDRNDDGVLNSSDMPRFAKIRERIESRIAAFDQNGDGKVTRAEFTGGPTILFDRADANQDGLVTRAELNAVRAAFESRQGQ